MRTEPVAVEGRDAVVRLQVRYGKPVRQEYRDLWVLRFAADGRVEDFQLDNVEGDTDPRPRFSRRPVGKRPSMPSDSEQRPLRSPEPSRGGPDIDAAVQNAESDTKTEGVHRSAPPGQAVGDSRLEQMREVDTSGERAEPDIPEGPLPGEVGAGGAQRIVGARISDRVAGGAERPAGPPFDDDGSGAGASPGPD